VTFDGFHGYPVRSLAIGVSVDPGVYYLLRLGTSSIRFRKVDCSVEILEKIDDWRAAYSRWQKARGGSAPLTEVDKDYPFVQNKRAPFTPARRALPMLNLAVISSAGGYIDGTQPFDVQSPDGDATFREIPIEVETEDLRFAGRGYDTTAVQSDMNSQVPIQRLLEFQGNGIIGQLNQVWWSFSGFIPNAAKIVDAMIPELIDRVHRYDVRAALLIPASRLCHQSVGLVARALEMDGIPTMMLAVDRQVVEYVRPPRVGYYAGAFGSVAGRPNFPEHQRRILDEALRWMEPLDQPTIRRLVVELESEVEKERGEK
jgi:D-proline reductase (dithiol) PrdB